MVQNERVLIDSHIAAAQAERDAPLPKDVAFETFTAEMALKEHNLTPEQIEAGRIGGGKDGAIDGVYVFLDDELLAEDSEIFDDDHLASKVRKNASIHLHLIQAKEETGFTETALDKVEVSTSKLLNLDSTDEELSVYYSAEVIARIRLFTRVWKKLLIRSPEVSIRFDYATKADTKNIAEAVAQKRIDLEQHLKSLVPGATTQVAFLGARELWEIADAVPEYDLQLRFTEYLSKADSYTGLVALADYFEFLCDPDGSLRGHLFDWNVRDYQGGVAVNRGIEETLESDSSDDFWWLNNGVTILCAGVTIGGDKTFTMQNVQIVNGMQTSHSIHSAITRIGAQVERSRNRSVLVRVFVTQDEAARDRIIRATNSQTKVADASLHATEDLHRQIEAYFFSRGWFYDRRKNFYKNMGRPADRIVSISGLGQAVIALGLSRPDDARARPSSLLSKEADYKQIFSSTLPLATYLWIAQFQRRTETLLRGVDEIDAHLRTNFRFHVGLYLVTRLKAAQIYSPTQLNALAAEPVSLTPEQVAEAMAAVAKLGTETARDEDAPIDRVAKSRSFVEKVIALALAP
ncbi:AIPR family protein [Agrococcus jenensis]|uniref:AIPR protein n=1 Tax=Agrococcus jenensis TaxID=46353 RepID=A0A3N2AP39_9MICO|nr:AIPR family protein [Agrococcus jenensis]ROR64678.1 AIPR protein [Agrococcus jenensis]